MIFDEGWIYLDTDDVLAIIERHGLGPVQVLGKIESCCARPRQSLGGASVYTSAPAKAGALAFALTRGHALVDGNKRLGALCGLVFCHENGFDLALTAEELVGVFWGIAEGELSEAEVIEFFAARLTVLPRRKDE